MKIKNTKTALISCVMAIFLSFTMLIGTTFAWLTDSSVSGINKIQSGNLEIGLIYTNSYNGDINCSGIYSEGFTYVKAEDFYKVN